MSSNNPVRSLKVLHKRRQASLKLLLRQEPVIIGNVYDVMRRCGNASCHCAVKPCHRQTLLIYTENGRRRCKFVRRRDAERIKQAWLRYKECKKVLRELLTLNNKEMGLLRVQLRLRDVRLSVGDNSGKAYPR
ncbi:MAG: hypothetical protein KKE98_08650 [Nanoarchaeota archaeon]|nr:hypothetical protein [Nanoarchaeota archaeon]